jgi:hypothetical protein
MPLAIPAPGGEATQRYYAFEPKRLQRMLGTEETFRKSRDYTSAAEVFERIITTCESRGIRIIYVYAPSAPAVVLPPAKDRVPAAGLRAFLAYRTKDLPPAEELKKQVFEQLDVQESMVAELCRKRGVGFISLTGPLREAVTRGEQVYYTYDQHWTPLGQAVAARTVARYLKENP